MAQLESLVSTPAKARCSSGCPGLDDVLAGGFPRGYFYLLEGEPGTGKTTLAQQLMAEGRQQHNGHELTLNENE